MTVAAERAKPHLLIAAGGTGGHMFPAQALAEAMVRRGWQVTLSTDARGARFTGGFPHVVGVRQVASASFARGGISARLAVPFRIVGGIAAAFWSMLRDRPAMVIGFGGYPTIPALSAAWLLRVPRVIHEQNGVPGRVNRLFASAVQGFACGTWPTALPAGIRATHTGNPVRAAVLARAAAPYIPPGDYPLSLLVIGGSQGARVLSETVPAALGHLPPALRRNLRLAHQARAEDAVAVAAAYEKSEIAAEVAPFFTDIPRRLSEAQLVISRAGAGSIADIAVIGRPAIVIPFAAAAGDHQSANAASFAAAGGALVLSEAEIAGEAGAVSLSAAIAGILKKPKTAEKMAAAALAYGIADATARLIALIDQVLAPPPEREALAEAPEGPPTKAETLVQTPRTDPSKPRQKAEPKPRKPKPRKVPK